MKCPSCKADIVDPNPRFCASCGATVGDPSAARQAEPEERVIWEGRSAVIGGVGGLLLTILTVGLGAIYLWIRTLSRHYRVTSTRIVIESGVFSKRLEQIDLYRVIDYVVERPFSQRLLGTGNIVIEATDRTTNEIRIEGIRADVVALYEQLRKATEADKRRRGVRVVDVESGTGLDGIDGHHHH